MYILVEHLKYLISLTEADAVLFVKDGHKEEGKYLLSVVGSVSCLSSLSRVLSREQF